MTQEASSTLGARTSLALRYAFFAAVATAVNIATQELSIHLYQGSYALLLSIAAGTATGLGVKYVLDKLYIFRFAADSLNHDLSLFMLYATMGLATTAIFWGTEYLFEILFADRAMRYLGAVIGLSIGYYVKYRLDKRFVFAQKHVVGHRGLNHATSKTDRPTRN